MGNQRMTLAASDNVSAWELRSALMANGSTRQQNGSTSWNRGNGNERDRYENWTTHTLAHRRFGHHDERTATRKKYRRGITVTITGNDLHTMRSTGPGIDRHREKTHLFAVRLACNGGNVRKKSWRMTRDATGTMVAWTVIRARAN